MGRRRRSARASRRVPAPAAPADGRVQLLGVALRPFRPGLRAHAHQLRPEDRRRHRGVSPVRRGGRRPRGGTRRLDLGRARRRPVARRTAAAHVRPRADGGVPRVQGDLGSGKQDEPRQAGLAVPPRRAPARPAVPPGGGAHAFRLPRGRQPRRCGDAVRRSGEVPQDRRRGHVPLLHGDRRRTAHDARPCPAPVRDAAGRGHHRGFPQRGGEGRAGPLPVVQELQERVPDGRRHGGLQGGVSRALLRRAAPAPAFVRLRPHQPLGGDGRVHAAPRERLHDGAAVQLTHQVGARRRA